MPLWNLKHRAVTVLAKRVPRVLPFRHLAAYHGTNKIHIGRGAAAHEYDGVDYAAVYERYLHGRRAQSLTLLELGVYRGESLRMWSDYLPRGTIVGVDIDPSAADRAPGFRSTSAHRMISIS